MFTGPIIGNRSIVPEFPAVGINVISNFLRLAPAQYTQTLTAVVFLSILLEGYTCTDLSVCKGTLQGYTRGFTLPSITSCGRDILLNPDPTLPPTAWKEHLMFKLISDTRPATKGPVDNPRTVDKMHDQTHEGSLMRLTAGLHAPCTVSLV